MLYNLEISAPSIIGRIETKMSKGFDLKTIGQWF
jgi:hypothetical protein